MPELGRDPIQEMNEILKDPLNEGKQKQSDQKNVTLFMILPTYLYLYFHFKSFQVAIIIHTTNSKMSKTLHPEDAENICFGSQVSDLCL